MVFRSVVTDYRLNAIPRRRFSFICYHWYIR